MNSFTTDTFPIELLDDEIEWPDTDQAFERRVTMPIFATEATLAVLE